MVPTIIATTGAGKQCVPCQTSDPPVCMDDVTEAQDRSTVPRREAAMAGVEGGATGALDETVVSGRESNRGQLVMHVSLLP